MMTWWKAASVRALKTAAQAAIGAIGTGAIGIMEVDWAGVVSIAIMAAIISYLTSIAGLPEVEEDERWHPDASDVPPIEGPSTEPPQNGGGIEGPDMFGETAKPSDGTTGRTAVIKLTGKIEWED